MKLKFKSCWTMHFTFHNLRTTINFTPWCGRKIPRHIGRPLHLGQSRSRESNWSWSNQSPVQGRWWETQCGTQETLTNRSKHFWIWQSKYDYINKCLGFRSNCCGRIPEMLAGGRRLLTDGCCSIVPRLDWSVSGFSRVKTWWLTLAMSLIPH